MRRLNTLNALQLAALCGAVSVGCDSETMNVHPYPPAPDMSVTGGMGGTSAPPSPTSDMTVAVTPDMAQPPAGGAGVMEPVCRDEPDLDVLATEVGPRLAASCGGAACHASNAPFNFRMPDGVTSNTDPLSADQAQAFLEIMRPDVRFGYPEQSSLFARATDGHASLTYDPGSNDATRLAEWIRAGRVCELPEPPTPMGGDMAGVMAGDMAGAMASPTPGAGSTQVFCDALPNGDPRNRPNYYEVFRDEVNAILTDSCAQSGCHAVPTQEYGFWIVGEDDPCSVQANFMTSQLYVNFANQLQSPILTKPIDPRHGGYMTFPRGGSDPDYIAIKSWITLGAVP